MHEYRFGSSIGRSKGISRNFSHREDAQHFLWNAASDFDALSDLRKWGYERGLGGRKTRKLLRQLSAYLVTGELVAWRPVKRPVKAKRSKSTLKFPGKVPVAAENFDALQELGDPWPLGDNKQSLVTVSNDRSDSVIVWASPELPTYKHVWDKAAKQGFVEPASEYGDKVDIDHVFPKSWANRPGSKIEYVRLFPVWAEVNRSAGGGIEKQRLNNGVFTSSKQGIIFAEEYQVLKMLGHPVGNLEKPVKIFGQ